MNRIAPGGGILYDVSRLIARRNAPNPTGIDRVDLRYALRAMAGVWGPTMFVAQVNGDPVEVSRSLARRLLSCLEEQWIYGRTGEQVDHVLKQAGLLDGAAAIEARQNGMRSVVAFASSRPGCLYLNSSHHGLGNLSMFLKLQHALGSGFVFFIHDLIPIELPEYVRPGDDLEHRRRMRNVLELGARVVVNSRATGATLAKWAEEQGFRAPRTAVAHIGVEAAFLRSEEHLEPDFSDPPSFVYVGTIEPRKNHITLLHVWRDLVRTLPSREIPRLVLIGKRGWECEHVFSILDRCKALSPYVTEFNSINDADLVQIMRASRAVLFPSFAEGWGMPLVEALALRVPVICSDLPVFHEASQGLADFVDPLDAACWRTRIIARARETAADNLKQRSRAVLFEPPTWERHFQTVDDFLLEAMESRSTHWGERRDSRIADGFEKPDVDPEAEASGPTLGIQTFSDFETAVAEGDNHRDNHCWVSAVAAYRGALKLRPNEAGILVQLGHALKESGRMASAHDAYMQALSLNPTDSDLHLQLGHLFKVTGRVRQAFAYYEAASNLSPGSLDAVQHLEWARAQVVA